MSTGRGRCIGASTGELRRNTGSTGDGAEAVGPAVFAPCADSSAAAAEPWLLLDSEGHEHGAVVCRNPLYLLPGVTLCATTGVFLPFLTDTVTPITYQQLSQH